MIDGPSRLWRERLKKFGPTLLLVLLSVAWVGRDFVQYREESRSRWTSFYHDRHAHCSYAMEMADVLRSGDLVGLYNTLQRNIVWPPLHGLVAALAMLVTDCDHRMVVFPAVLGSVLLLVFGSLAARQGVPHPIGGWVAATTAWLFIAQSPAHRAYSTDCLLEGLGAGLSALSIYLYGRVRQHPTYARWWWFGLSLTLLFFEKSNYWLIVALAVGFAHAISIVLSPRNSLFPMAKDFLRAVQRVAWRESQQPLIWVGLAVLLAVGVICVAGIHSLTIAGKEVRVYPPGTLLLVGYAALFARGAILARRGRWFSSDSVGPAWAALFATHVAPIAISFLLPKRLLMNLWFLSPANGGESATRPIAQAAQMYLQFIATDYHVAWGWGVLAAALILLVIVRARTISSAGWAILAVVGIATVLLLLHPNQKARFLHSWWGLAWVAGGMGLGSLFLGRARWLAGPLATVVLVVLGAGALRDRPVSMMVDQQPGESLLDLSDWYLERVDGANRVAILSTIPDDHFFRWTAREEFGKPGAVENDRWLWWPIEDPLKFESQFRGWLERTEADAVVVIDVPKDSPQFREVQHPYEIYRQLPVLMEGQSRFRSIETQQIDGCRVSIWRPVGWAQGSSSHDNRK